MLALVAARPGGRNQKGMGYGNRSRVAEKSWTSSTSPSRSCSLQSALPIVPLLWAMKRQVESEAGVSVVGCAGGPLFPWCQAVMPPVTDVEGPFTDVSALAA